MVVGNEEGGGGGDSREEPKQYPGESGFVALHGAAIIALIPKREAADMDAATRVTRQLGIEVPIICGAMYPCSNPELVAAASEAGGIGIVQPLSLEYVHGYPFHEGLERIRRLTDKPVGLNVIVERSSKKYLDRMRQYVEESLQQGIRFFVTSLGNPTWVVDLAHSVGGLVYHDVTERRWALKARDYGVDGLIRSVAVAPAARGRGWGARLVEEIEHLAVETSVKECYLITMDAAGFFERFGYRRVQRAHVPDSICTTREFAELCELHAITNYYVQKWYSLTKTVLA